MDSLTVFSSENVSSFSVGILGSCTNKNQSLIFSYHEDGSLAMSKVTYLKNGTSVIRTFLTQAGKNNLNVSGAAFVNEELVVVTYLSGQIALISANTLLPVSISERVGGAVWGVTCVEENRIVCAVADGSIHIYTIEATELVLKQILPKVTGSNRCVSVFGYGEVVIAGDDMGHLVAWFVSADYSTSRQLWLLRLPKGGYAKCITAVRSNNTIFVGSSIGDSIFVIDGSIVASFTKHEGPVSCCVEANGSVFASGWHESLRAFRFDESRSKWFPAEVKRRTHYHETTSLLFLQKSGEVVSMSRDGTAMTCNTKNIQLPARYVRVLPRVCEFNSHHGLLFVGAGRAIEIYEGVKDFSQWVPRARVELAGGENISKIVTSNNHVVVVTRTRVRFYQVVSSSAKKIVSLRCILDFECCGVSDAVSTKNGWLLLHNKLTSVQFIQSGHSVSDFPCPNAHTICICGENCERVLICNAITSELFESTVTSSGAIGPWITSSRKCDHLCNSSSIGVFNGEYYDLEHDNTLFLGSPKDLHFISRVNLEGSPCEKKARTEVRSCDESFLGWSPKGVFLVSKTQSSLLHGFEKKHSKNSLESIAHAFAHGSNVLILTRDIDAEVESLPLMWKVRRFGN